MLRHTVAFRLRHSKGSAEEAEFIAALRSLRAIPGVEKFEVLKQVGAKNKYTYGLSMEFVDSSAYQSYNVDPEHVRFVQNRWIPEIEEFIELDYVVLE